MGMKSDVKAVEITSTGTIFAGRTRLRGIIVNSNTSSANGSISLYSDTSLEFKAQVFASDVFAFNMPEDGILFKDGLVCSAISNCVSTVLIDK